MISSVSGDHLTPSVKKKKIYRWHISSCPLIRKVFRCVSLSTSMLFTFIFFKKNSVTPYGSSLYFYTVYICLKKMSVTQHAPPVSILQAQQGVRRRSRPLVHNKEKIHMTKITWFLRLYFFFPQPPPNASVFFAIWVISYLLSAGASWSTWKLLELQEIA